MIYLVLIYFMKKRKNMLNEVFEYIKPIKERFNRVPIQSELFQKFLFFVNGLAANSHPFFKLLKYN